MDSVRLEVWGRAMLSLFYFIFPTMGKRFRGWDSLCVVNKFEGVNPG